MLLTHPMFDPVALRLGPVAIHWYGIMYLLSFLIAIYVARWRAQHVEHVKSQNWSFQNIENQLFYCMLGVVIGGRLGEVLFYRFDYFVHHPLKIFAVWEGGMSFHGGLLGVLVAFFYGAYKQKRSFFEVSDFWAVLVPIGLGLGRIGNFINGELWGRATDGNWGMIFPQANDGGIPRHPSQLYEMCLEGFVLFGLLWWVASKPRKNGFISGVFLLGYGLARFTVEFVREPDPLWRDMPLMTMGQWLCMPMIIAGLCLLLLTCSNSTNNKKVTP